jgi:hypothetical protein
MTFKRRPNRYAIDIAPSGRAKCRACKSTIEKGAVRMVIFAFVRPTRATQFVRCVPCVGGGLGARAFASAVIQSHGRANRVPVHPSVPLDTAKQIVEALERQTGPVAA